MTTESTQPSAEAPKGTGRFVDWDGDTILDVDQRLLWTKKDTYQITGKWMNWVQAREFVQELNRKTFGGFSDWRLPTTAEAKSLYSKKESNTDHMGQKVPHVSAFPPGFGFLCWTGDVRNKVQAVRFGYRKGMPLYDNIYRTSRGSTRFVRDIEREDGLL